MTEFTVNDKVRTTVNWSAKYNRHQPLIGEILEIREIGPMSPNRPILVRVDNSPFQFLDLLWFNSDDLELND